MKLIAAIALCSVVVSPAFAQPSYTAVLRIHCKDRDNGSDRAYTDLTVTSTSSCADARNSAQQQAQSKDQCRYGGGQDDASRVATGRTEWIATNTCR